MKKVITFLGTKPQSTRYSLGDQIFSGDVFAHALRQFLEFDQMLVFVTERARSEVYPGLKALEDERIIPVDIPIGETPGEMWDIFEKLTSQIEDNDEVTFDITHGLRSIPFLVFLAAAFLKSARTVSIKAIYYGAYELRSVTEDNTAPIIDLSEFVSLLDWLNASEQFMRFGDASQLAVRLKRAGDNYSDSSLKKAAEVLEKVSRSLRLILPDQAMEASYELNGTLQFAETAIQKYARPFAVLSQQVSRSYDFLALQNPRAKGHLHSSLNLERQIIQWYRDRNLLVQAVTLAREWIISWCMGHVGFTFLYDTSDRKDIGEKLGDAANKDPRFHPLIAFSNGASLMAIPEYEKAINLWPELTKLRNTLDHAGKRRSPLGPDQIEDKAKELFDLIDALPLP